MDAIMLVRSFYEGQTFLYEFVKFSPTEFGFFPLAGLARNHRSRKFADNATHLADSLLRFTPALRPEGSLHNPRKFLTARIDRIWAADS
jgi:hypothetical protein